MTWLPTDEEIRSALGLDGPTRYRYFVKKAADAQQVWSLQRDDRWALAGDDAGHELVPVWPHEKFALLSAAGKWAGYEATAIDLDAWLVRWIPGMQKDSRLVAVFPTPQDKGVAVEPRRLEADLREEMAQYE
jgi:hypothetical protein